MLTQKQNQKIKAFYQNIQKAKKRAADENFPNTKLGQRVEKEILDVIYDFICSEPQLLKIRALKPDDALHIAKEELPLPIDKQGRSIEIICDPDGTLRLIILTKRKLAGHSLDQILKDLSDPLRGAFKESGKIAIQAVPEEQELLQLMIKRHPEQELLLAMKGESYDIFGLLKEECEMASSIKSSYVDKPFLGQRFGDSRTGKAERQSFFTSLASEGNLSSFLKKRKLNKEEQNKLIIDLLNGVKDIHQHGIIHQDLRDDNLLVDEIEGKLHLKISDFGSAVFKEKEIREEGETQLVRGKIRGAAQAFSPEEAENYAIDPFAHSANDMWAMGLIIWKIRNPEKELNLFDKHALLYLDNPKFVAKIFKNGVIDDLRKKVENDPLLKGLFDERAYRLTAQDAIKIFNAQLKNPQKANEIYEQIRKEKMREQEEELEKSKNEASQSSK